MSAPFFSKFPKRYYDTLGDSVLRQVTDIFRFVDVNELLGDTGAGAYTFTSIQDGERPDVLSYRLYGTTDYYWTFFILNDTLKEGINHSWPLSSEELELTFEREYDPYSVITFLPAYSTGTDGLVSQGNTFSGVVLSDEFLPYLQLLTTSVVPGASVRTSSIFKWDDTLMQLWVHGASGDLSATSSFKLGWNNPFEEDSDEWLANETLKGSYIEQMLAIFEKSDPAGFGSYSDILNDLGVSDPSLIPSIKYDYVFGKLYTKSHFWSSARNAAAYFYSATDETDILTPVDAAGSPNYVSNYALEEAINTTKSKIRVVNSDSIAAFSAQYFATLKK